MSRDVIFGFVFGCALGVAGLPFYTWQYWLLLLLAVAWRFSVDFVRTRTSP